MPKRKQLDLGDGHWLEWVYYQNEITGGNIIHTTDKTETGKCWGAFWLKDSSFIRSTQDGQQRPQWELSGTFDKPTLSPSFACHCGDHGYVREGKWVKA